MVVTRMKRLKNKLLTFYLLHEDALTHLGLVVGFCTMYLGQDNLFIAASGCAACLGLIAPAVITEKINISFNWLKHNEPNNPEIISFVQAVMQSDFDTLKNLGEYWFEKTTLVAKNAFSFFSILKSGYTICISK